MPELVQLEYGIVYGVKVKMGCDNIGIYIVRRVLYRAEIINRFISRHNYHTGRVLTGGLLYLSFFYKRGKPVELRAA